MKTKTRATSTRSKRVRRALEEQVLDYVRRDDPNAGEVTIEISLSGARARVRYKSKRAIQELLRGNTMAKWQVEYRAYMNWDAKSPEAGIEIPCFRIFPEGEPDSWIAQTNPALPREVQEEIALQIADALFNLLGV